MFHLYTAYNYQVYWNLRQEHRQTKASFFHSEGAVFKSSPCQFLVSLDKTQSAFASVDCILNTVNSSQCYFYELSGKKHLRIHKLQNAKEIKNSAFLYNQKHNILLILRISMNIFKVSFKKSKVKVIIKP